MERSLAPHEAAITAADVRLVLSCDVTGDLDDAVLAQALTHLQTSTPLLTGKITQGPGNQPLVLIADAAAGPVLGRGTDFDEEINAPLTWECASASPGSNSAATGARGWCGARGRPRCRSIPWSRASC
ncbi:hypothetical protein ACFVQ0_20620 [Streptomyces sp. NPDC057900]|uniref:hypothetical protein n=1 Tax=Streptomyces sp. NPDC057900 TaxID=3346274 RepID=UPI0036EEB6AF